MFLQTLIMNHKIVFVTLNPETGAAEVVDRPLSPGRPFGPVGIALLRRRLSYLRQVWALDAPSWGCGRQDRFGEIMDAARDDLNATSYRGEL